MSYLEILAYISVGMITFSWILVLVFDIGKKIIVRKANKSMMDKNLESESN